MSDGTEQRVQLDRPGLDSDRPVDRAADGSPGQPGEDARQPHPRDVVEPPEEQRLRQNLREAADDLEAAERLGAGPSRIEFYRGLNRIERHQADARDKILRELGITVGLVGFYALLAGYSTYSAARRSAKLRRKGMAA